MRGEIFAIERMLKTRPPYDIAKVTIKNQVSFFRQSVYYIYYI